MLRSRTAVSCEPGINEDPLTQRKRGLLIALGSTHPAATGAGQCATKLTWFLTAGISLPDRPVNSPGSVNSASAAPSFCYFANNP